MVEIGQGVRTPTGKIGVIVDHFSGDDVVVIRCMDGYLEACFASHTGRIFAEQRIGDNNASTIQTDANGSCGVNCH
jgi:hypothetical protein